MCTAISLNTKDHYFGRNLDLDHSYSEEVCIMPRHFCIKLKKMEEITEHYAMIGMATVVDNTPLFYDAVNEHGLCMAALNFTNNAYYNEIKYFKDNITPFEFIPWILGQCKSVSEAKELLKNLNLVNIQFNKDLSLASLHWIIADSSHSIVVESMKDGLHIYDNPVGVLTNNPPFEYQLSNLEKYRNLQTDNANVTYEKDLPYSSFSQGLGAVGLPGDVSSKSRFVRAVFCVKNSVCEDNEMASVGQFFHLLSSVEMVRGICKTDEGKLYKTNYSTCINSGKGLYYYTTYSNRRITCINMHNTDLDADKISRFPLCLNQDVMYQN